MGDMKLLVLVTLCLMALSQYTVEAKPCCDGGDGGDDGDDGEDGGSEEPCNGEDDGGDDGNGDDGGDGGFGWDLTKKSGGGHILFLNVTL